MYTKKCWLWLLVHGNDWKQIEQKLTKFLRKCAKETKSWDQKLL